MKELWNSRYKSNEFVYGKKPNQFLKETLDRLELKGKILFPAEGEGRNAIYAAKKGLSVYAFDISFQGKNKALNFAKEENVIIQYEVGEINDLNYIDESFDVASLIYAHFAPDIRSIYHRKISDLIKPNGIVILEGFSKNNLKIKKENPNVGGPNNIEMLYSIDQIKNDFENFEIVELQELKIELNEGSLHNGFGKVIRFIGRKKMPI